MLKLLVDWDKQIGEGRNLHVSIARLMELLNRIKDIKDSDSSLKPQVEKLAYSYLIQALYPVAPHLTSEVW